MSQSSTHMLCSTFVSAKIRHGNLKTSVFNFCGSMLPGFADFNAKNNKKNLHDCNEYMHVIWTKTHRKELQTKLRETS